MNALLGNITKVRKRRDRGRCANGLGALEVTFRPVCTMPARLRPPEWLKDQELKVVRRVADTREVGGVGDSIVLSPAESARWLFPLEVTPPVVHGHVPRRLDVRLRWWKESKPPEATVRANGRRRTVRLRKRGEQFHAAIATGPFFDAAPSLPTTIEVTLDKLKVGCVVLPVGGCCREAWTARGRRHRLESPWYALDVFPGSGGGIAALREVGRGVDHYQADESLVQEVLQQGGHRDRVIVGWKDRLRRVDLECVGTRRGTEGTRLCLAGGVDEAGGVRTTVAYTVLQRLPLVLIRRDVLRHKPRKKPADKDERRPRLAVDDLLRIGLGFRAAYRVEPNGAAGSRVLSVDGDRLAVRRCAQMHEWFWNRWRLTDGWALAEHPGRRECMLYLLDAKDPPELAVWLGDRVMTVEPSWLPRPVRADGGAGFAAGIVAGEICGAGAGGAWVAVRRPADGSGVECALVGRFRADPAGPAQFRVGRSRATAPLERLLLPGVGGVRAAVAHLPKGRMTARFHVAAGGIGTRSTT